MTDSFINSTLGDLDSLRANEARVGYAQAAERLRAVLAAPPELQKQRLDRILSVSIVDKLVLPAVMKFHPQGAEGRLTMSYQLVRGKPNPEEELQVHRHALGQLADYAGLAYGPFVLKFLGPWPEDQHWRTELLAHNFNTVFERGVYTDRKGNPTKLLHRTVGKELRGVLSRKYNRKLTTVSLLRPFLETCQEQQAVVASTRQTDIKVALTCLLPLVFEPIDGEFVALGATFSNSDFGAGRTRVSGMCLRLRVGTASILEDALCQVHLGSVIQESDLTLSEETADAELRTHQLAVRDATRAVLAPESISKVLGLIQVAHEAKVPWHVAKKKLAAVLQKSEIDLVESLLTGESSEVVDLPPLVQQEATAWWVSSALGWLANKQEDTDRRLDMQNLAGKFIAGSF